MLGERINILRTACGWSQVDLAKRLGVAKQTVSNWENENIQPSIEMLLQLARVFNTSTDYLLGLDQTPRLSLDGLSEQAVSHLSLLVEDLRQSNTR